AALRQAQKLMDTHGITDAEVESLEIDEVHSTTGSSGMPTVHLNSLANVVAMAFGTKVFCILRPSWSASKSQFSFVGREDRAALSGYVFDVLRRKLAAARSDYIKGMRKSIKRSTKTTRGDLFCR